MSYLVGIIELGVQKERCANFMTSINTFFFFVFNKSPTEAKRLRKYLELKAIKVYLSPFLHEFL